MCKNKFVLNGYQRRLKPQPKQTQLHLNPLNSPFMEYDRIKSARLSLIERLRIFPCSLGLRIEN